MAGKDVEINIKVRGLKELRAELKDLESELATASDPQQMEELATAAGKVRGEIKAANTQLEVMSSTDPFKQASTSFGIMSEQLMNLDFKGAAKSANLFANSVKGINPAAIGGTFKSLGSVVLSLGKAFMSVGLSLLVNPIFLIAATIAAIVGVIVLLLSKLGLLKPILNAIGKVFKWIGMVIDAVVQSIKDFLDWIGLTSFAQEDAAKRQVAALEKVDKARENHINKVEKQFDLQIRLAQIDGKNTTDLERRKQQAILETAKARYHATIEQIKQMKLTGDADEEEIKKLLEKAKALRETAEGARNEIKVINAKEKADKKKDLEEKQKLEDDAAKTASEKRKAAADKKAEEDKKRIEEEYKREQERLKNLQQLEQDFYAQLEATESAYQDSLLTKRQQEENAVRDKYFTLIEQAKQYGADSSILEQAQAAELKAIKDAYYAEDLKAAQEASLKIMQEDIAAKQKAVEEQQAFNEARLNLGGELVKGLQGLDNLLQAAGVKTAGLQKTIALVQIATDTAKAISATIAGAAAAASAGGAAAPFLLAGYIASGIGTVLSAVASAWAALKKAPPIGGSVSGSAPTPQAAVQSATPNVNLFGQNNDLNNLTSTPSNESTQNIMVQAVVSETELTATQNKIKKITQNAVL